MHAWSRSVSNLFLDYQLMARPDMLDQPQFRTSRDVSDADREHDRTIRTRDVLPWFRSVFRTLSGAHRIRHARRFRLGSKPCQEDSYSRHADGRAIRGLGFPNRMWEQHPNYNWQQGHAARSVHDHRYRDEFNGLVSAHYAKLKSHSAVKLKWNSEKWPPSAQDLQYEDDPVRGWYGAEHGGDSRRAAISSLQRSKQGGRDKSEQIGKRSCLQLRKRWPRMLDY
jgi:hypothetical protein